MKILIMGLPGSGKTTLASKLVTLLNAKWLVNEEAAILIQQSDFSVQNLKDIYVMLVCGIQT